MSSNPLIILLRLAFASLLMTITIASTRAGTEDYNVQLASGRRFQATISNRTNEAKLWLQFGTESTQLLRPIHWDRVVAATQDGKSFTADEFRALAIAAAKKAPASEPKKSKIITIINPAKTGQPTYAQLATKALAPRRRVTHIDVAASLGNWDGDVEQDGLVVQVAPLDANGQIVNARGTVEVSLVAPKYHSFSTVPHGRGMAHKKIGSWTRSVSWQDGELKQLRLPFQAVHPEFTNAVGTHGLVHIRMTVPGSGVFEQSVELVRIRPFSPIRDDQQRNSGRRFFPQERTGRGRTVR